MNPIKSAQAIQVPAWVLPAPVQAGSIYEAAALMGIEGQWIRMSADDQRALMGFPVFGRRAFMVRGDGVIEVARSTCFGADCEIHEYSPERVRLAASNGKQLSPGMFGPAFA